MGGPAKEEEGLKSGLQGERTRSGWPHQDLAESIDTSGVTTPKFKAKGNTEGCEHERLARAAAAEYWPSGCAS